MIECEVCQALKDRKYSPDQPRDDHGRWTGEGGSADEGGSGGSTSEANALRTFEDRFRGLDQEHAQAIGADGALLLGPAGWTSSSSNYVSFSPEQIDGLTGKDATFTHNHPSNMSFSPEDLAFAAKIDAKEMRAVGPTTSYSMKRGPDGWPPGEYIRGVAQTAHANISAAHPTWETWPTAKSPHEASVLFSDAVIRAVAEQYPRGLIYERRAR